MPYIGHEQIAVAGVLQVAPLTIPAGTQRAQLQADGADIRYTMDAAVNPTAALGMILQDGLAPEWFEFEDLVRLRVISPGAATLEVHYYTPRVI